jgi:hypothetical protein
MLGIRGDEDGLRRLQSHCMIQGVQEVMIEIHGKTTGLLIYFPFRAHGQLHGQKSLKQGDRLGWGYTSQDGRYFR